MASYTIHIARDKLAEDFIPTFVIKGKYDKEGNSFLQGKIREINLKIKQNGCEQFLIEPVRLRQGNRNSSLTSKRPQKRGISLSLRMVRLGMV